jgi:hypothetical protein
MNVFVAAYTRLEARGLLAEELVLRRKLLR